MRKKICFGLASLKKKCFFRFTSKMLVFEPNFCVFTLHDVLYKNQEIQRILKVIAKVKGNSKKLTKQADIDEICLRSVCFHEIKLLCNQQTRLPSNTYFSIREREVCNITNIYELKLICRYPFEETIKSVSPTLLLIKRWQNDVFDRIIQLQVITRHINSDYAILKARIG